MMIVRVILVETTLPVKIRPRIETRPVKGHFLSITVVNQCQSAKRSTRRTNVGPVDRLSRRLEAKPNILVPPLVLPADLLVACMI